MDTVQILELWDYVLNGSVDWSGEDRNAAGTIFVRNNAIDTLSMIP